MKRIIAVLLFCFAAFFAATAQDTTLYQKAEFVFAEGKVLPYRIMFPENYDRSKKYPLILVLHGAGERGKDNVKQLVHGSKLFAADSNRKNFAAIVVFPQCPRRIVLGGNKVRPYHTAL